MFCHNCGNKLEDNAVFCDNCGAKVKEEDTYSRQDSNQEYERVNQEYNNQSQYKTSINTDEIKEKIKYGTENIKQSNVVNILINFIKRPVTTGIKVVKNPPVKDLFILIGIFILVGIITSILSISSVEDVYYGYGSGFVGKIIFRMLGTIIIATAIGVLIGSLVTALFLKVGNSEDVIKKGFSITVMSSGLSILLGFIAALAMKVSVIIAVIISVVAILLYLNYYFILFMQSVSTSANAKFILPVVSIIVYGFITAVILMEVIARSAISNVLGIYNWYNFF